MRHQGQSGRRIVELLAAIRASRHRGAHPESDTCGGRRREVYDILAQAAPQRPQLVSAGTQPIPPPPTRCSIR